MAVTISPPTPWAANWDGRIDGLYPSGDKPTDSWRLSPTQFTPSRFPLQWLNPNGTETTRSAYLYSHSQFNYERTITVFGGSPPYYFSLQTPDPAVTVTRKAPSWNPGLYCWADIVIDYTQFASGTKNITLVCEDQNGTKITLPLAITVNDSKFTVIDAATPVSGVGTLADPLKTMADMYGVSESDATYQDQILVLRGGSYLIDNYDPANGSMQMNANKPSGWIPYPGEAISFTCDSGTVVGIPGGARVIDYYFGEATYNGSDATADNSQVFSLLGQQSNVVFDRPYFSNPVGGVLQNANEACIYGANATSTGFGHDSISVIDPTFDGLPRTGAGFIPFDMYDGKMGCFGGKVINSDFTNGAFYKARNSYGILYGFDGYNLTNPNADAMITFQQGSAGVLAAEGITQALGCKAYAPDDSNFIVSIGDSNELWGDAWLDRCTIQGRVGWQGGDANINGALLIEDCIVINDLSPAVPADMPVSNLISDTRANIATYINATTGDVLPAYSGYGLVGANYVDKS